MADETLSLSDDDFDGPRIRPPQPRPSSSRPKDSRVSGRSSRDLHQRSARDRRDDPGLRRDGGVGRDRQRSQGSGSSRRRGERSPERNRPPADSRRRPHQHPRGPRDGRESGAKREDHRRRPTDSGRAPRRGEKEEDRLKMEKERMRRDEETRRRLVEMSEHEDRVKRKRDTSAEGVKIKRSREEAIENKEEDPKEENESSGDEESGEAEDGVSDDSSSEEGEDSDTSSEESDDTASEQSGATPDHITDKEEEEEELEVEKEVVLEISDDQEDEASSKTRRRRHHRKKSRPNPEKEDEDMKGRWRDRSPSDRSTHEDRTPVRSPTPLREEEGALEDDDREDQEDVRLEEALRGELKDRLMAIAEGTPKSQSPFLGDKLPGEETARNTPTALIEEVGEERIRLPLYLPSVYGCRSVAEYHTLNRIEEGTFGVVYRARDKKTGEIVALKRLKMEHEKEGFPKSSLREINTLLISQHVNVVPVREIVVGSNIDQIFIVMDFVQHDLKTLMEAMRKEKKAFSIGEIKCLMYQLLKAIAHLHDNWILHRDLKASNILLGHDGTLKVGDFGLAREYGSPLKPYTQLVVTLWYRAPELLLGQREYSTHIDVWSIGCIFAELLQMKPLFCGTSEQDQLGKIFKMLGTPSEKIWPGYDALPLTQQINFPTHTKSHLRQQIPFPSDEFTAEGMQLLQSLLTYDPRQRATCAGWIRAAEGPAGRQEAVGKARQYFGQHPRIVGRDGIASWPAKSETVGGERTAPSSKPPSGGADCKKANEDEEEFASLASAGGGFDFAARNSVSTLSGWQLKY